MDEKHILEALRQGDETVFAEMVETYYAPMLRVAMIYVSDNRVAEEAIQETWIGVLRGLHRFEGRSALKTWIFSILVNRARSLIRREDRYIPFSEFETDEADSGEPSVPAERFHSSDDAEAGHWISRPRRWDEIPEERLLALETRDHIHRAIEGLPPNQREVITLRDVEGWGSDEVCNVLGISETNQRVLLHRARSRVRQALEDYLNQ